MQHVSAEMPHHSPEQINAIEIALMSRYGDESKWVEMYARAFRRYADEHQDIHERFRSEPEAVLYEIEQELPKMVVH